MCKLFLSEKHIYKDSYNHTSVARMQNRIIWAGDTQTEMLIKYGHEKRKECPPLHNNYCGMFFLDLAGENNCC